MFAYRQKIIVYVTNQMLMTSLWYGKQYQSHQTYQNEEAGHTAFRQYLSRHKKATIEVVVDAVEEEYQLEVLPHVTGSARREMLIRKLTQFSRNSVYKAAWFMHQETTARKEDAYVLLSLATPHFLHHWMAILQSEQALLAGVYALPMLSQLMVREIKIVPPQLLICERLSAGLRQTYLQDGRLRFSRLTPIDNLQTSQLVNCYVAEVEKIHLYLRSQRLINDAFMFQVMLSSIDAEHHAVMEKLEQQGFNCRIASRQDTLKKLDLKQSDVTLYPQLHYLQLLNEVGIKANLAPTEMTKDYRLKHLTNKMYMIAAVIAMIGLCISASLFVQGVNKNEQINHLTNLTNLLQKQHTLLISHLPASPIAGADMKTVVTTAQMLNEQSPISMMQVISMALKDTPEVKISRIRWVQSNEENMLDEESRALSEQANQTSGLDSALLQIGFVDAKVNQFDGDYQQTLAIANRLVTNLRLDNRVKKIEVMQMPVDATLVSQGSTSDQLAIKPASVVFKLKIIFSAAEKEGL